MITGTAATLFVRGHTPACPSEQHVVAGGRGWRGRRVGARVVWRAAEEPRRQEPEGGQVGGVRDGRGRHSGDHGQHERPPHSRPSRPSQTSTGR